VSKLITILVAAGLLGVIVAFLVAAVQNKNGRVNIKTVLITFLVILVAVTGIGAIMDSYTQVEAGTVAVVKQFGKVTGVFYPGLNLKMPFIQNVVVYRTQEIVYETSSHPEESKADYTDYAVDTATSDGQQISARYTVRFRIDPARATDILMNLGTEKEVVEKVVKANSRVRVRNILKQYPAKDLYSGNVEVAQQHIATKLKADFDREGLTLVFFGLRSIEFTDEYKQAVENKQIEAENITTKENLAKQAEYEKQRTITQAQGEAERQRLERIGEAQGEAEAIKVQAQAQAEAIKIKAEAQAKANELIAKSLTPEMIRWQAVTVWNGQYPTVLGGGQQLILPGDLFARNNVATSPQTTTPITSTTTSP